MQQLTFCHANGYGFSSTDIWILGDSIPFWAGQRAKDTGKANLDMPNESTIAWWGIRGMSWAHLAHSIQLDIALRRPPLIVAIHLGGNDLIAMRTEVLCGTIKTGLTSIREALPSAHLLWIDILPRLTWRCPPEDFPKIDKKRKRVNRWGRQQVSALGHSSILSVDIDRQTPGFFHDGIHLSNVGLEFYLDSLRDAMIRALT